MNRRGMTLLELLVAMILTGIVSFIVLEMLIGEKANYTVTRRKIGLQSDAREAMRILEEEIKNTGFRISSSYANRTSMGEVVSGRAIYANGASFDPSPSATIYGGGTGLEIRFYNPMMKANFDSLSDLWTIGYKYDPTTKILSRQAVKGWSNLPLKADGFVPLLDSVQQFSLSYGRFQENIVLQKPTDVSGTWSGLSPVYGNADTSVTYTFGTGSGLAAAYLTTPSWTVDPNATYRVSFWSRASDSLLDTLKGLGKTAIPGQGFVKAGFYSGSTLIDSFTFCPLANVKRSVQYDLVHVGVLPSGTLSFGLCVNLLGTSSALRTLTIGGLTITRLNSGKYLDWSDASHIADASKIRAIRMRLVASNKKHSSSGSGMTSDQIVLDRIIPVVNNGN